MSSVRVLVGTRKGAFILTSDGKRQKWNVTGPHFGGWEIYHMKGSPVDPNRIYASQSSSWFGQIIQRSNDGGKTWEQPGTKPGEPMKRPKACPKAKATNSSTNGKSRHPSCGTTARRIPGNSNASGISSLRSPIPISVYAGVEDAAIFKTTDGGKNWQELPACAVHGTGPSGSPARAACVCTRSCSIPSNPESNFHRHLRGRRISHG